MLSTLDGISMLVKLLHLENALSPMLVTLDGISMLVRLSQPENACPPMLVTLPSMGITLFLQPAIIILLAVFVFFFRGTGTKPEPAAPDYCEQFFEEEDAKAATATPPL